ncbi:MAG TPA: hypothetical protein VME44_18045 [Streptosporangiaceae bacterium]|nr:hypothetical protein [Streptosporangiaceae bacterium]
MNADQVAALRALLAPTGWLDRTSLFARALRRSARTPSGLLIVGTSSYEPWHMAAHLDDESLLAGLPELAPTLVRWDPEPGAPPHLSIGLDRLRATSRAETLLVVSPDPAPAQLLERVDDVRRTGATIFALDADDPELDGLAHESLPVRQGIAPFSFDAAQHLVTGAVAEDGDLVGLRHSASRAPRSPGIGEVSGSVRGTGTLRARLARLLDAVSGPAGD